MWPGDPRRHEASCHRAPAEGPGVPADTVFSEFDKPLQSIRPACFPALLRLAPRYARRVQGFRAEKGKRKRSVRPPYRPAPNNRLAFEFRLYWGQKGPWLPFRRVVLPKTLLLI